MAASMWRMNGLCRSMTGVLLLCALLFSREVMCQNDSPPPAVEAPDASTAPATQAPNETNAPDAAPTSTAKPDAAVGHSDEPSGDSAGSSIPPVVVPKSRHNDEDGGTQEIPDVLHSAAVITARYPLITPTVDCVGEGVIPEQNAVKAELTTKDCEETKHIIEENPLQWCSSDQCSMKIFQENNNILIISSDLELSSLAGALKSEALKDKLGLKNVDVPTSSSSNSSVFVGILVTGLLAALGMIVGYFKCQRKPDTKGEKLAEEAYPVDQENQGNTLASEAPLNPPPETPEKPSVNGESLEAVKTETSPPTNGHSTAKTADTEL